MEEELEINNEVVVLNDKMMRALWKGILKIELIELPAGGLKDNSEVVLEFLVYSFN